MGPPMPPARDVLHTLQDFRAAQDERVQQYRLFNEGFNAYLSSKHEGPYRALVASTTREFASINERVRGAEARLRDELARPDLATHLRAVQEGERQKLHYTLIQQVLKEKEAEGGSSRQPMPRGEAQGNGHSHQSQRCSPAPEPTQEELTNALAEATQELQAAVVAINEALEELRYAEEELLEGGKE